jgi:uncharacterized protein with von Willebrand factor type A (vWA) domain
VEATLTRFVRALRQAGAEVSPAETLDAAEAMALLGYGDRAALKTALGVTLAKTPEDKALHDQMFEQFFASLAPNAEADTEADPKADTEAGSRTADREGEAPNAAGDPLSGAADAMMQLAAASDLDIDLALQRAAAVVGADDIRFSSQSGFFARRMLEQMGVRDLEERLIERLQQGGEEDPDAAAMMAARARLFDRARAMIEQRFDVFGRGATELFMDEVVVSRSLAELSSRDLDRMRAIVARMARRLAIRHGRRRRRRTGQIDVRRTIRASLRNEAIPFDLYWKQTRKEKPKIVAICDVSGSVARYVRFLLLLLHALHEGVADLRAFAFSSRLHDVEPILKSLPFDAAMSRILRVAGGGSTDYGQALVDLDTRHADAIDRRTTVLILGDGRSNRSDPRLDLFAELADRSKRVVWLAPEPEGMWGTGDSCLLQYRPFCAHMASCRTALDIERAIDEVLAVYN